jgi:Protein of unknown function (DUF3443)
MIRSICVLGVLLLLAACGGGGGGGSSSSGSSGSPPPPPPPPATLNNFVSMIVDDGPAALDTGPNAFTSDDAAFVSVTICAPGSTTNCQTIDHVLVDTGSVGLRLIQSNLTPSVLSALPLERDSSGNPVGECYSFVDGLTFGSVRQADFTIGGEAVADMPLQIVGDTGAFTSVPSSCSSGGGMDLNTVQALGANGIIGIGVTTTDCGTFCEVSGGFSAATYYDCPSSGCSTIITRNAATTAPFQQLPNPVAAMSVDNNGTIMTFPTVPAAGEATVTGTLFFGIGTETNNTLASSAKVLTTTNSESANGSGLVTAVYKGANLPDSFLDSGSNAYFFVDTTIAGCTQADFSGFYCPASPLSLTPTIEGQNGVTASGAFTLQNAETLFQNNIAAAPGIGINPNAISSFQPFPNSFDFGLPFFFGRSVYTAIEGRQAGTATGPYFAF